MLFWAFIYTLLYKLLVYFRGVPDLGPFLAGKLLGMILIGFFSILLLSNVITALSSFFLARDLDLLVGAPVDWLKLYGAKLLETGVNSSWMVCCWRCRCSPRSARRITAAGCSRCS
jgi:ABC-2 type transport system permease protein